MTLLLKLRGVYLRISLVKVENLTVVDTIQTKQDFN